MSNFQKIQLKSKIVKHFTRSKQQATLKKLCSLPRPTPTIKKLVPSLEEKFSDGDIQKYTDIYACFQSASRMQFWGVKKWCSANLFSDTKQKRFCWEICKVRKVFGCVLREHILFSVKWVEIRKMSEVFWAKLYCKMIHFFASFCWLWDFLLENLKLKETPLMMSTGTYGRM